MLVCLPQIMDAVYEKDPNGATLAFADMMRKQIVMPAHLMDDGEHHGKTGRNLFAVSTTAIAEQSSAIRRAGVQQELDCATSFAAERPSNTLTVLQFAACAVLNAGLCTAPVPDCVSPCICVTLVFTIPFQNFCGWRAMGKQLSLLCLC